MTAVYQLAADLPDGRQVKAIWNSKFHQHVSTYVLADGAIESKQQLPDLAAVDAWAAELGVSGWRLAKSIRVSPFAATLPIQFPEAPPPEVLAQALARVVAGADFKQLAAELSNHDPVKLRAWLKGHDPACEAVGRLEVPGLHTDEIWGGQF